MFECVWGIQTRGDKRGLQAVKHNIFRPNPRILFVVKNVRLQILETLILETSFLHCQNRNGLKEESRMIRERKRRFFCYIKLLLH